jgi:hypothetical protein
LLDAPAQAQPLTQLKFLRHLFDTLSLAEIVKRLSGDDFPCENRVRVQRGPKSQRNPLEDEVQKLRRQNGRLAEDLRKAHIIIDVPPKVAALLGNPIPELDPDLEEKS